MSISVTYLQPSFYIFQIQYYRYKYTHPGFTLILLHFTGDAALRLMKNENTIIVIFVDAHRDTFPPKGFLIAATPKI